MNYPHPFIAKEGWPFIGISLLLVLFSYIFLIPFITFLCFVVLVFVVQFFRDPPRAVIEVAGGIHSPADGRIVKVEQVRDPYTERDALMISVFMNVFNVHSNRASINGTVQNVTYIPGSFFNADLDKASEQNERNAVVIQTEDGQTVTLVQIAGLVARRILCYVRPGDKLHAGDRYGFIRFGSRVDVYLPTTATPCVSIGDKVYATTTILATL